MASRGSVPSETKRLKPRVWQRPPGGFEGLQASVLTPCAPVLCLPAASVKGLGLCAVLCQPRVEHANDKYDQQHIIAAIETQLLHQPAHETRHRKRLRPNALAEWDLRVQTFRVFYDVDVAQRVVKIAAVGYKQGNALFIHGEEYQL